MTSKEVVRLALFSCHQPKAEDDDPEPTRKSERIKHTMDYESFKEKFVEDLKDRLDELAVMDGGKCIVQVRGVRPFLSSKYDLTQHPNYPLTADADKRNLFDIEKFLNHNLILKPDDQYEVIEINED